MNSPLLPKETERFEIEAFKRPKDIKMLKMNHVAFSGSPRKHPYDPRRVVLVADPYSSNTFYYELQIDDIVYVQDLPSMVNLEEEVIPMVRVWVLKGSIAIRCTPFVVEDTFK